MNYLPFIGKIYITQHNIADNANALENYEQIIDLNYNGDVSTLKSIHHTNRVEWNDSTSLKKDLREKKLIRKSMNEYF